MRTYLSSMLCVTVLACGGVGGTGLGDGGDTDGGDSSTGNDSGGSDAPTKDAPAGDSSDPCPDEHGRYDVTFSGQGCGPVANTAQACIQETSCTITISTLGGGSNAISGTTPIQSDGSFTGAAITEGTSNRTGCVATWDQTTATLTIDCGGTGTSQSCRATLVRKSPGCN